MIVAVDRVVPGQHGQDGRHGEHVGDAMLLHQAPGFLAVQPLARQQDGRRTARHLRQSMHPRAMRQRRHHQRDVLLGRRRHQVAQMVADDVFHLAVRQHARLRPTGRAGGIEEPCRMVMRHVGSARELRVVRRQQVPFQRPRPDGNFQPARGIFRFRRRGMVGERRIEDMHRRTGRRRQIRHFRRGQPEIRRYPHRAEHPRCEHCLQDGVGIARVQQHAVAGSHAARRQGTGCRLDPRREFGPGPGALPPDDCGPVGKAPRGLQQQMCEVADRDQRPRFAARRHGAAWPRQLCGRRETNSRTAGLRPP